MTLLPLQNSLPGISKPHLLLLDLILAARSSHCVCLWLPRQCHGFLHFHPPSIHTTTKFSSLKHIPTSPRLPTCVCTSHICQN
uniref:Uncharacterized protein n=1 Tax=Physcomitrium patens TaxID=3218 RepID=A0A2K1KJG5_PHYPA|nr:hypothetical protein PHYPA_007594 [Physcomitrium patens]